MQNKQWREERADNLAAAAANTPTASQLFGNVAGYGIINEEKERKMMQKMNVQEKRK